MRENAPENINPELTKKLIADIQFNSRKGTYRTHVNVFGHDVLMDVYP